MPPSELDFLCLFWWIWIFFVCFGGFSLFALVGKDRIKRFRNKSKWVPEITDPMLDLFLKNLEFKVLSINECGVNYSNLSYNERKALRDLKSYPDIVIKKADKGSAVVVWGLDQYCKEALGQLRDKNVYEKVESNPMHRVTSLIDGKLQKLVREGKISEENREYLKGESLNLGRFYLLPKIHKRLIDVPGRPVISNCGTPTERISEFVDYHINPIVKSLPTVLRDTSDFLRKLEDLGYIPETAIFATIDVVGLYPHIPHGEGLDSMKEILNEFKGKVNYGEWYVDGVDLVEMATIILENNYFEFDGQIYWQKQGTAIGTKFAPAYANIFMYVLETRMLGICEFRPWIW